MCAYFVDVSTLEDVISERVKVTSAWTERFVSVTMNQQAVLDDD